MSLDIKKHSYSDNIYNKNILIFGPQIPPIGGVSVHIDRVGKVYKNNNNNLLIFDATQEIIKTGKLKYAYKIFNKIKKFRPDIIDYHTSFLSYYISELLILVVFKLIFKFKINIIDHDPRYLYKRYLYNKSFFSKKLLNILLNFVDSQVIIGSKTYQSYIDNNILLKNYSIQSAFLPPDLIMNSLEKLNYPESLISFIDSKFIIILMNAFKIALLDGQDLYGIDKAINLINFLNSSLKNSSFNNFGLVILYQSCDQEYFKIILQKIKKLNLEDNIFLLQGNYLLWPLFAKAKLFIRPTLSDGYSVSIEESLYFNIPVVASNVCQRPEGSILFDIEDGNDFNIKVYNLLKGLDNERNFNKRDIMYEKSS